MTKRIIPLSLIILIIHFSFQVSLFGQKAIITSYSTNSNGQIELEVNSTDQNYFILKIRQNKSDSFDIPVSMTFGNANKTIITEPLEAFPIEHYEVLKYYINDPYDTDGDGIDDVTEFQNSPIQSPNNAALSINKNDGFVMIDNFSTFTELSVKKDRIKWSEFLNEKEFVKFIIVDFFTNPKIYFINSKLHDLHEDFAKSIGIDFIGDHVKKGQVIYHPKSLSNNGTLGTYAFNYSNGHSRDFEVVQRTNELLAANMPFLQNNLSYLITENNEEQYKIDSILYLNSRIPILLEADIYADLDYWGLNPAEGFGFFREADLEDVPGPKDIVLYESLPNSLPRVAGIMTSVVQTPLSHVNLRAIQNNIPNAFIRNPLSNDTIADLLDEYVYYKVEPNRYIIRKATLEEVNNWFAHLRPKEEQIPPLNLEHTSILPLDQIEFDMHDGFGAKCTNVATMLTFGFPDKTIPNGFGIPFYYYQEFMKYNKFFQEVEEMIQNTDFISDRIVRKDVLKKFRKKIEAAEMPTWMMNELAAVHATFPEGTSLRCRSSSNNEDLPGFNGAGLYSSKTQRPDEGHLSKSIKEVFASLWNLRAFEERDFHRVNHFSSSMGVLCHPNYSDEKANGVGVSSDPIHQTSNTFYLNTQIGEDLITNPNSHSIPEEILLDIEYTDGKGYTVMEHSNLIASDSIIMSDQHLDQMRDYLSVIHNEFQYLYDAVGNNSFAMDIEYKITSEDQLIIKQARPWVSFVPQTDSIVNPEKITINLYPNPTSEYLTVLCESCGLAKVRIINLVGQQCLEETTPISRNTLKKIRIKELPRGVYIFNAFGTDNSLFYSEKFMKN